MVSDFLSWGYFVDFSSTVACYHVLSVCYGDVSQSYVWFKPAQKIVFVNSQESRREQQADTRIRKSALYSMPVRFWPSHVSQSQGQTACHPEPRVTRFVEMVHGHNYNMTDWLACICDLLSCPARPTHPVSPLSFGPDQVII